MKRISFHLAKINDHTGSIKRKLVLVLSCSERWNGEWIESERHVNRTNEWQHMEKCWKSGKRKGEKKKKKQKLSSVERLLERWIEWTFDGIFERFYRAGWCSPVCFSVPILDAPLFSQIFIFATLPRFLADNATPPLCSARTRKQLCLKTEDEGITIRDFHSLRAFCSFLLSQNNLTNAFWGTRWKRLRCCWFKKKIRAIFFAIFSKKKRKIM